MEKVSLIAYVVELENNLKNTETMRQEFDKVKKNYFTHFFV